MTKIIQYVLEIISSIISFVNSKRKKENEDSEIRDTIRDHTSDEWLRTFGGQDKRTNSSSKGEHSD